MRILAFDTTGPYCAVAIRQTDQDDLIVCDEIGRGHAERLAPMVHELLQTAGLEPTHLDRIAVTIGPGSFAGTRVGVAFARGLALATGATPLGLSNLEWWAQSHAQFRHGEVLAVHDAKRGEFVTQLFKSGRAVSPPETHSIEDAQARLSAHPVDLIGSGVALLTGSQGLPLVPNMALLLDMAAERDRALERPKPFYARPPDAKLPGGAVPS